MKSEFPSFDSSERPRATVPSGENVFCGVASPAHETSLSRRGFLACAARVAAVAGIDGAAALGQETQTPVNLARVATPSSQVTTSENKISALNDGFTPR